jgi:hypothetical protein
LLTVGALEFALGLNARALKRRTMSTRRLLAAPAFLTHLQTGIWMIGVDAESQALARRLGRQLLEQWQIAARRRVWKATNQLYIGVGKRRWRHILVHVHETVRVGRAAPVAVLAHGTARGGGAGVIDARRARAIDVVGAVAEVAARERRIRHVAIHARLGARQHAVRDAVDEHRVGVGARRAITAAVVHVASHNLLHRLGERALPHKVVVGQAVERARRLVHAVEERLVDEWRAGAIPHLVERPDKVGGGVLGVLDPLVAASPDRRVVVNDRVRAHVGGILARDRLQIGPDVVPQAELAGGEHVAEHLGGPRERDLLPLGVPLELAVLGVVADQLGPLEPERREPLEVVAVNDHRHGDRVGLRAGKIAQNAVAIDNVAIAEAIVERVQRLHRDRLALGDELVHVERLEKHAVGIDHNHNVVGRLGVLEPVHDRERLIVRLVDVVGPVVGRRDVRRHADRFRRLARRQQTRQLGILPAHFFEPEVVEARLPLHVVAVLGRVDHMHRPLGHNRRRVALGLVHATANTCATSIAVTATTAGRMCSRMRRHLQTFVITIIVLYELR